jgi:hypothetical protein
MEKPAPYVTVRVRFSGMRPSGFEPLASSSGGMRSIQLSYGRLEMSVTPAPNERAATGRYVCLAKECDGREANKPSSVSCTCAHAPAREVDHFSGTAVARGLVQPTRDSDGAGRASPLIWPCSGWGLPCHSCHQERGGLLHRRFTLACATRAAIGGLLSVALSVALRRPAVSRHPALRSSDFPRRRHPKVVTPRSTLASRIVNQQSPTHTPLTCRTCKQVSPVRTARCPMRVPQERSSEDCSSSGCTAPPSPRKRTQCARQDSNLKPPDP